MSGDVLDQALAALADAGWDVRRRSGGGVSLPDVLRRHPALPPGYRLFLKTVEICANPPGDAWFLTLADFAADDARRNAKGTFRWNEWECLSREAAEVDGDEEAAGRVRAFWSVHLPIALSVRSDYAYLALSFQPQSYGAVVYGYAPEFEEAVLVAVSFEQYLSQLVQCVVGQPSARAFLDFC